MSRLHRIILCAVLVALIVPAARAERIKDVVRFDDDPASEVIGTGLVVGLSGTGDGSGFQASIKALVRNLEQLGVTVDPAGLRTKNVAMVQLTATLHASAREGNTYDVTVASIGDAKSLEGGSLLPASLVGVVDGQVYAIAQGPLSVGGFGVSGGANNSIQKNHPTVGRVPSGMRVLRRVPRPEPRVANLGLVLNHPDRGTASNIAKAINLQYPGTAVAEDAGYVRIDLPDSYRHDRVGFSAVVGDLLTAIDAKARVVVNERTGTIVVGGGVNLREAAVAHGSLTIEIRTEYHVSQPTPFSQGGETVVVPQVDTYVDDQEAHLFRLPATTTVQDLVDILNGIGATPRDIISILQALRAAGSLQAELEIL